MKKIVKIEKDIEEIRNKLNIVSNDFDRRIDDLTKIQEKIVKALEKNQQINILLDAKLKQKAKEVEK